MQAQFLSLHNTESQIHGLIYEACREWMMPIIAAESSPLTLINVHIQHYHIVLELESYQTRLNAFKVWSRKLLVWI